MEIIDSKIQGNLLQEFTVKYLEEHKELVEHIRETTKKQLILTDVVKPLKDKYEIVFEDWLKDHKFEQSNNGFHKNGIEYKVNEITWMYIQDVYNL